MYINLSNQYSLELQQPTKCWSMS